MAGEAIVARARALIGVPFRLHGRDALGLDCVGLAIHAYRATDIAAAYTLRTSDIARWTALLDARLVRRPAGRLAPGDLLLLRAGAAQLHLAIWAGEGFVHAHAGLRRVVETPGPPPWPLLGAWFSRKEK